MPSIYQLKPLFQQSLSGIVRRLAEAGATANQVTLLAALLSVILGAALAWSPGSQVLWLALPALVQWDPAIILMAGNTVCADTTCTTPPGMPVWARD